MRKASILIHNQRTGILTELDNGHFIFQYDIGYIGEPISLTMPVRVEPYLFDRFPPFFEGLLPEGIQLEGLLKTHKIDKTDYLSQLIATGEDLVGAVTVQSFNLPNE